MNGRKANWAFLITTIGYIGLAFSMALFFPALGNSLVLSNLFCELVVVLPVFLFTVVSGEKTGSFLGFHRMKISSVLMVILFTFLSLPALSLFNLISQLWVKNEVAAMMESQMDVSFGWLFLSLGLVAPVFEEVTCRGFYYQSYKKSGGAFKAMLLSALIFALVHMNFNQAAYAFVMGILAVLLVEATGSLWSSVLYHGLINTSQAVLMYGILKGNTQAYSEQAAAIDRDFLLYAIGVYVILTAIGLTLSWAVLVWISNNEGRRGILARIWREKRERPQGREASAQGESFYDKKRDKVVTLPFIIACLLSLGVMTGAFAVLAMKIFVYFGMNFA